MQANRVFVPRGYEGLIRPANLAGSAAAVQTGAELQPRADQWAGRGTALILPLCQKMHKELGQVEISFLLIRRDIQFIKAAAVSDGRLDGTLASDCLSSKKIRSDSKMMAAVQLMLAIDTGVSSHVFLFNVLLFSGGGGGG